MSARPRSPSDRLSRRDARRLIAVAAVSAALLSWWWPLAWLDYPFRLLVTLVHELGHGLSALATGGRFLRFVVSPDGSGVAYTAGGWRFVVIAAGYLGAAAFAAGLILLGGSARAGRTALGVLGGVFLVAGLRYGLPSVFTDGGSGLLTLLSSLTFGALFLWVALRADAPWIAFLVHLVAFQAVLDAFSDLWVLVGLASLTPNSQNDAQAMAQLTGLPAILWALLWGGVAIVFVVGAARRAWFR